jgi:putative transposase
VPISEYSRVEVVPGMAVREPSPDLTTVPDSAWTEAARRCQIIQQVADNPRRTKADMRGAARHLGCSIARAYVLLRQYQAEPRVTTLLPRRPGPPVGLSRLAHDLDALVDEVIEGMYLTKQKARLSDIAVEVRRRCHALGVRAPGRKAITTRVRQKPRALVVARREGRSAARDRYQPIQGSLESPSPLALIQIDHTLVDVIVVDSITRTPIQRPWLTLAIDVHSRCVAGFHLSLEPPSAVSVALCVTHAALPKEAWVAQRSIDVEWPVSGIFATLHLDNAKEFRSEALRRGCQQYGIAIEYRPVRTPHYGGHIERLIGTLMGKVHLLPGTTYSGIDEKGAIDPQKTAAMTIDEVERWLGHAIAGVYHRNLHQGIGTTPIAAWERGIAAGVQQCTVSDPRRFLIDFLPIERRLVRREGVLLNSIAYWSDVLRGWVGEPTPMIVRYDPRDLSRIYLQGPDNVYYDLAYRDIRRPPISEWENRRAKKRLRDEGYAHVDEGAIFRTINAMREITQGAKSATKSARRDRERRRRAESALVPAPIEKSAKGVSRSTEPPTAPLTEIFPVEDWG